MHAQNVTYQATGVWGQVRDLSASRGDLGRSRGDHHHAASCNGGKAQWTLMAAGTYGIKWLICGQIFCWVHAVSVLYQANLQPNCFFWSGCCAFTDRSHNRSNFGQAGLLSTCLDQSSVRSDRRRASVTGVCGVV